MRCRHLFDRHPKGRCTVNGCPCNAYKYSHIQLHRLNRSVKVDDVVYTEEEQFRDEWWWKWPGVVREASETEDFVVVEFMGFAQMVTRRRKFDRLHLKVMEDDVMRARIDRVLRYIRLTKEGAVQETPLPMTKKQVNPSPEAEAEADATEES